MGFQESDKQYGRGQDALNAYGNATKDYQAGDDVYQKQMAGYRNEDYGYANDIAAEQKNAAGVNYNMSTGLSGLNHDLHTNQGNLNIGLNNQYYGGQQGVLSNMIQNEGAASAGRMGALAGLAGAAMGAVGAGQRQAPANTTPGAVPPPSPAAPAAAAAAPPNYGPGAATTTYSGRSSPYPGRANYA
jgi:hypothetical protein